MSPAPVLSQLLATDPLLNNLDGGVFLIVLVKTVVAFGALLGSVLLAGWWERKLCGFMQSR